MSNEQQKFIERVGKSIAELRKAQSLTQEQLAGATGLSRMAIALIETGKKKPSLDSLFKIARALDVKPARLLE